MKRDLQADLAQLGSLAFRRVGRCGPLLERFHSNSSRIDKSSMSAQFWRVYEWLCCPFSLWPIDFEGLAKHLLQQIEKRGRIDRDIKMLLGLVGVPPDEETQLAIGAFEHMVEAGNYDHLVRQPEKFKEHEASLANDTELAKAWRDLKSRWKTSSFQNSRGVVKRRMSQERNLRGNWEFDWQDSNKKFYILFDAMCYRWKLYGMEHDKPLPLKISVNPTPHGTMIVIPRHWSLDLARDLYWNKIGALHRSRGAARQGPKLSVTRVEKHQEAAKVLRLWKDAGKRGVRGAARHDFILREMKKDIRTDQSWVLRNLRVARKANLQ